MGENLHPWVCYPPFGSAGRFYPSDPDLCHMVPQRLGHRQGGWAAHSGRASVALGGRSPAPKPGEAFPTVPLRRGVPSRGPASSALAESRVTIRADFQISIGSVRGVCGSLGAGEACHLTFSRGQRSWGVSSPGTGFRAVPPTVGGLVRPHFLEPF